MNIPSLLFAIWQENKIKIISADLICKKIRIDFSKLEYILEHTKLEYVSKYENKQE